MRLNLLRFRALVIALALAASLSAANYRETLAAADALAAEKSWDQARLRYADALAAAPDSIERLRCELLIEDASWRSEANDRSHWRERERWQQRHLAVYDRLEEPYVHGGRERDPFWTAVLTSRAKFEQYLHLPVAWQHALAVAEHLGRQPPSREAAERYVAFLQDILAQPLSPVPREFDLLKQHLANGAKIGATADDRAWCSWQLARLEDVVSAFAGLGGVHTPEHLQEWSDALTAAVGTKWAPLVQAEEFLWRILSRFSPGLPENTPADIPTILAELREKRAALGGTSDEATRSALNRLDSLERNLATPRFEAEMAGLFAPGAPIRLRLGTCGARRLEMALDQVEPRDWIAIPENRYGAVRPAPPRPNARQPIREWSIDLPDATQLAWTQRSVEVVPRLSPGCYVLTIVGEVPKGQSPLTWQRKLLVSTVRGLGTFVSAADSKLFFFRAADGAPISSASVSLFESESPETQKWSGTTDGHGAVTIPALDERSRSLIALVDGEPVCFDETAMWGGGPRTLLVDAFTDGPLFRPGETAHWKLVVRDHRDGTFFVPANVSGLKVRVTLNDTTLVETTPLDLSRMGTMHGEIVIPRNARPGEARLELFRGAAAPRLVDSATTLFQVDNFVPPAAGATLEFAGDARSFRAGREVTARAHAAYFSGGPVVGAPVRFTFSVEGGYDPQSKELSDWQIALAQSPRSARTDANGTAEATLELPNFLPEGTRLKASAEITPDGAPAMKADGSVTISSSGVTLDPLGWISPRLVPLDAALPFSAMLRDGRNEPVPALETRIQLNEVRWSEVWLDARGNRVPDSTVDEFLQSHGPRHEPPEGWKLVYSGYTESPVASAAVRSSPKGQLESVFKVPHPGVFRFRVTLRSGESIPIASSGYPVHPFFTSTRSTQSPPERASHQLEALSCVAVDAETTSLALSPDVSAVIAPAQVPWAGPFEALAIVPTGASQAWITIAGESAVQTEPLLLRGRLAFHRFSKVPALLGETDLGLTYRVGTDWVGGGVHASVPQETARRKLQLSVRPDAGESRPGSPAHVVLTAKDAAGLPAIGAEVAVGVSDEAVHSLVEDDASATTPLFLNFRRTVLHRTLFSRDDALRTPQLLTDPRSGAIRNPTTDFLDDDDTIELSQFTVATGMGYAASATLAGTRLGTDLMDSASALSVISDKFLSESSSAPPAIELRRHFVSIAFWSPEVITDAKGEARVSFTYPDNLTRWRIAAYAVGANEDTFGSAVAFTETALPFQARLQLPRFLVTGDTADVSAALVNRAAAEVQAVATLSVSGAASLQLPASQEQPNLLVSRNAEAHPFWSVKASEAGEATFQLTARTAAEGDAMKLTIPVHEDGFPQHTAAFGRLGKDAASSEFSLELPATLDPSRTEVSIQLSPNYAVTLLDALPYLIDYPYGCVEQTMSRFLAVVVVRKTLRDLGLDPGAIERRILRSESAADRAQREKTAGFAHFDDVVNQSLSRLADAAATGQGFGWWPGDPHPDIWMTAYVTWGLALARESGVKVTRNLDTLTTSMLVQLVTSANHDAIDDRLAFAWAALARSPHTALLARPGTLPPLFEKAFGAREHLSASGRACLALAAAKFGTREQRAVLLRNLSNGLQRASGAELGDTAHWGLDHSYWRATDGAVESTALTLLALLKLDPDNALIEPAANWLALNRRSAHWTNTRDTAFAILALNQFLQQRGNLDSEGEVELLADDRSLQRFTFARASLLDHMTTVRLPATALHGGKNRFILRRLSGQSPVHATVFATSWARSEDTKPQAHLIEVARAFERQKAEPTLVGTLRLVSESLDPHGIARASEEVTARIQLSAPIELEYVMIAVPKPAGCKPLNPRSGWDAHLVRLDDAGHTAAVSQDEATLLPGTEDRLVYREEHDDRSVFFLDHLEAGRWELRFRLRAITPGDYRALPVTAEAMYAPEITANSDARRVKIIR